MFKEGRLRVKGNLDSKESDSTSSDNSEVLNLGGHPSNVLNGRLDLDTNTPSDAICSMYLLQFLFETRQGPRCCKKGLLQR